MIKKLEIDNFKGIEKVEFKPGRINLIVGRNNMGKTSILEAINLFYKIKETKLKYIEYEFPGYLIKYGSEQGRISINEDELVFSHDNALLLNILKDVEQYLRKHRKELEKNGKEKGKLPASLLKDYDEVVDVFLLYFSKIAKEGNNGNYAVAILKNKRVLLGNFFSPHAEKNFLYYSPLYERLLFKEDIELPVTEIIYASNVTQPLLKITKRRKLQEDEVSRLIALEKIIKKYGLLENFERFLEGYAIFKGSKKIPLELLGDGFKQFLTILHHIENGKNIILLDEPTAFMHPGYIKQMRDYLIEFLKKRREAQFFITTHNLDFVTSFFMFADEEFLEKNLKVLRMLKIRESIVGEELSYAEAKEEIEKLQLDLRGI